MNFACVCTCHSFGRKKLSSQGAWNQHSEGFHSPSRKGWAKHVVLIAIRQHYLENLVTILGICSLKLPPRENWAQFQNGVANFYQANLKMALNMFAIKWRICQCDCLNIQEPRRFQWGLVSFLHFSYIFHIYIRRNSMLEFLLFAFELLTALFGCRCIFFNEDPSF